MDFSWLQQIAAQLAPQIREMAKDAGTSCSLPECSALTPGARCEKCARRICLTHAFWRVTTTLPPKFFPYCPYCVVQLNHKLWNDVDDAPPLDRPDSAG